jgi:drug/metabolite transporter (DMT)-like permease
MVTEANPSRVMVTARRAAETERPVRREAGPARRGAASVQLACLAAVYLVWSSTYLATRIAVTELPPALMAGMRFVVAGAAMLAIARWRGAAWPTREQWRRAAGPGVLLFVTGSGFIAIAETTVSSGGAAVVCATMPLFAAVIAAVTGERPSRREWWSLALGFVGVVVLIGSPSLAGRPVHVVLLLMSPLGWAIGSLWSRRIPAPAVPTRGDAFALPAIQMLTGGVVLLAIALASGETLPATVSATTWACIAYLVVFGSLIGFTAYAWLLRNARPAVATSYAYVNPGLAVLFGAALYGEPLAWTTAAANVLIVAAIVLALRKR